MKLKFGAIVVDGRNKVGGHVASKNRSGAYLRTKVTPVNPQTTSQQTNRGVLTSFSKEWSNLTDTQRASWNAAVAEFAKTDIFGDIKNPSGFNLFMQLNKNLYTIGVGMISLPPLKDNPFLNGPFTLTGAETGQTLSLAWTGGAVPAGVNWVVEATEQVSPGVTFVKNKFRIIQVLAAAATSPQSIAAAYIAKFGALIEGRKIYVRVTPYSITTGIKGGAASTFDTVAA